MKLPDFTEKISTDFIVFSTKVKRETFQRNY